MARAGWHIIAAARIRFGRDGRWYADGEPILNRRIADLFSRHICRDPNGDYQLVIGDERTAIEVEDTPYVVVSVSGTAHDGFMIHLNDGCEEPLDPDSLMVGADEVISCAVKGREERARFLRAAYYQLAPCIEELNGRFCLRCRDTPHLIARR